jgi:hypothetical protein
MHVMGQATPREEYGPGLKPVFRGKTPYDRPFIDRSVQWHPVCPRKRDGRITGAQRDVYPGFARRRKDFWPHLRVRLSGMFAERLGGSTCTGKWGPGCRLPGLQRSSDCGCEVPLRRLFPARRTRGDVASHETGSELHDVVSHLTRRGKPL